MGMIYESRKFAHSSYDLTKNKFFFMMFRRFRIENSTDLRSYAERMTGKVPGTRLYCIVLEMMIRGYFHLGGE